ncbi:MAG TPA: hypothetical protein VJ824_14120 [Bacillota bacterium]|nr:hypothetical protein [Bacillota bacterium]
MIVQVEGTDEKILEHITKEKLMFFFSELKRCRKEKTESLALKIEQFEKKRMAEERMYRSLSPLRKLIVGKRPDHHLAVEHMVYVKRPLQEIDELSFQIRLIEQLEKLLNEDQPIQLPPSLANELFQLYTDSLGKEAKS